MSILCLESEFKILEKVVFGISLPVLVIAFQLSSYYLHVLCFLCFVCFVSHMS